MSLRKSNGPGDYDVGRGKPPRHTQFKPGQSGNPRGRPKRALGKQQQLANAMDQPTRDMFMAEMNRVLTVAADGKKLTMPAIQVIIRSLVKTAAEGGQQAQRTAIMMQLELERDAATERAECVRLAKELKKAGAELLVQYRARGLPEDELVPHPDDIYIDEVAMRAEIRGPSTPEQKVAFDKALALRDGYQRGVIGLQGEAVGKPRDWTLPMLAVMAQYRFDGINNALPERYRRKLEMRMTPAAIQAAHAKAKKGLAARRLRRRRAGTG